VTFKPLLLLVTVPCGKSLGKFEYFFKYFSDHALRFVSVIGKKHKLRAKTHSFAQFAAKKRPALLNGWPCCQDAV
jgi:hypothetical protein